ncbi:hypothetical protein Y1Q_0016324 [Alligator mississippiensis]|uniref:Uncharacterized protein n=1 Tax=Alligator mississippiensis TaxID=8496 RepID=A0A151N2D0_ALLMI|nr:hypothetical protein Y1Q_0016324 [Alligator mississippiensis]
MEQSRLMHALPGEKRKGPRNRGLIRFGGGSCWMHRDGGIDEIGNEAAEPPSKAFEIKEMPVVWEDVLEIPS